MSESPIISAQKGIDGTNGTNGIGWQAGADPNDIRNSNSGQVGIGTPAPERPLHVVAEGSGDVSYFDTYQATPNVGMRRANGTLANPGKVLAGEPISHLNFRGYYDDGAGGEGFTSAVAGIRVVAVGDFNAPNGGGTAMELRTSALGGGSNNVRMTINESGVVIIANMPTSSAGLPAGSLWRNGNVVNIV